MRLVVMALDAIPLGLIGCYGAEWVETPAIDRFAFEGFVFDLCLSESPRSRTWLEVGVIYSDLLGRLNQAGVATRFLSDATDIHAGPQSLGFTHLAGRAAEAVPRHQWANLEALLAHPEYRLGENPAADDPWVERWRRQLGRDDRFLREATPRSLDTLLDDARSLLSDVSEPSLTWIEVSLAGGDWLPPESYHRKYLSEDLAAGVRDPRPGHVGDLYSPDDVEAIRATWAGRVSYFDQRLGEILSVFEDDGQTLVVLTSDQGFPLGEHDEIGLAAGSAYEERVHVPLIFWGGGVEPGGRTAALTQAADLERVIATAFDLPASANEREFDPLRHARGQSTPRRDRIFISSDSASSAVQAREWKLVLPGPGATGHSPPRELFVRPEDRWDQYDVAAAHGEIADEWERVLREARRPRGDSA